MKMSSRNYYYDNGDSMAGFVPMLIPLILKGIFVLVRAIFYMIVDTVHAFREAAR